MLLHINPTRQRGKRTGSLARASGWYMTFFAAGVIVQTPEAGVRVGVEADLGGQRLAVKRSALVESRESEVALERQPAGASRPNAPWS